MKKILLSLVFGLLITVSTMAQSKAEKGTAKKIQQIESVTKLSDSEKASFSKLNIAYMTKHFEIKPLKQSDPAKYKTEAKANKTEFLKNLSAAVGEERANEIINAAKKKKGKKGKKKKKH